MRVGDGEPKPVYAGSTNIDRHIRGEKDYGVVILVGPQLGRVDIHFVQMKALTMTSMDTKALGVCS